MFGTLLRTAKYASTAMSTYLDYGQPVEIWTHKKWDRLFMHAKTTAVEIMVNGTEWE